MGDLIVILLTQQSIILTMLLCMYVILNVLLPYSFDTSAVISVIIYHLIFLEKDPTFSRSYSYALGFALLLGFSFGSLPSSIAKLALSISICSLMCSASRSAIVALRASNTISQRSIVSSSSK